MSLVSRALSVSTEESTGQNRKRCSWPTAKSIFVEQTETVRFRLAPTGRPESGYATNPIGTEVLEDPSNGRRTYRLLPTAISSTRGYALTGNRFGADRGLRGRARTCRSGRFGGMLVMAHSERSALSGLSRRRVGACSRSHRVAVGPPGYQPNASTAPRSPSASASQRRRSSRRVVNTRCRGSASGSTFSQMKRPLGRAERVQPLSWLRATSGCSGSKGTTSDQPVTITGVRQSTRSAVVCAKMPAVVSV